MTLLNRTPARRSDAGRWAVYDQHAPAIRAYAARRVEPDAVDDVVAETFAIAWRKLPREADPLPWLYAVARRVVHGHRRSHARRSALLQKVAGSTTEAGSDPAEQVHGDPSLARAFATLTEQEREAIRLVAWEGLEHADAARAAGCTRATFAVRLSRARLRLRKTLAELEAGEGQEAAAPLAPRSEHDAHHVAQAAPAIAQTAPQIAQPAPPMAAIPNLEVSR
ncbi:RNA polymerase sigma factor [Conexibacter stalactiti]|uniref:RNA polymerase sigma factor n=1 Tax=Conexibacter stalactiti TaxID=1940611 RepID=A0ABU4HRB5_9ACTN|nr:RNA polymerase sigma factor [Conexibacter stalactiti]MDW5595828.1 RNA polymerase sigma factor [Conexibacter stalactiti]MEC5036470.1 RNA polymerase sigma factor [Conexibacter stalactiti]